MSSNRKFDQIAMLNVPVDKDEYNITSFYIHGTRFKSYLKIADLKNKNYILDCPLFKGLPNNAEFRITRNSNIKD